MTTGQFLRRLCRNDIALQLKVDRVLAPHFHPVELAALENQPLRKGAEELYMLFFGRVIARLAFHEPGTRGWHRIISEERAFFEIIMARCRAMRLPIEKVEEAGIQVFEIFKNLKPIGEQLKQVLDRIGKDLLSDISVIFGPRPSEN